MGLSLGGEPLGRASVWRGAAGGHLAGAWWERGGGAVDTGAGVGGVMGQPSRWPGVEALLQLEIAPCTWWGEGPSMDFLVASLGQAGLRYHPHPHPGSGERAPSILVPSPLGQHPGGRRDK